MSGHDADRIRHRALLWLRHAEEDARIAQGCLRLDPPSLSGCAYHCQQAAEKLLKGFLVLAAEGFRKTHDLESLSDAVVLHFPTLRPLLTTVGDWTAWGVAYRYPGEDDPDPEPSLEELLAALKVVHQIGAALRSQLPPLTIT